MPQSHTLGKVVCNVKRNLLHANSALIQTKLVVDLGLTGICLFMCLTNIKMKSFLFLKKYLNQALHAQEHLLTQYLPLRLQNWCHRHLCIQSLLFKTSNLNYLLMSLMEIHLTQTNHSIMKLGMLMIFLVTTLAWISVATMKLCLLLSETSLSTLRRRKINCISSKNFFHPMVGKGNCVLGNIKAR